MTEGAVSIHAPEGSKVTDVLLTDPRMGLGGGAHNELGRAVLCPRSEASRRQRIGKQAPTTYKVVGAEVTNLLWAQF